MNPGYVFTIANIRNPSIGHLLLDWLGHPQGDEKRSSVPFERPNQPSRNHQIYAYPFQESDAQWVDSKKGCYEDTIKSVDDDFHHVDRSLPKVVISRACVLIYEIVSPTNH